MVDQVLNLGYDTYIYIFLFPLSKSFLIGKASRTVVGTHSFNFSLK